jgi:hypothetical protein
MSTTGLGAYIQGSGSGNGVRIDGGASGDGLQVNAGGGNAHAISIYGAGAGYAVYGTGGATGGGMRMAAGGGNASGITGVKSGTGLNFDTIDLFTTTGAFNPTAWSQINAKVDLLQSTLVNLLLQIKNKQSAV